jgi:hypothetical protein
MKGWEEIADDEWLDDFQGEEDFAWPINIITKGKENE